jgi:hypothetical protein
MADLPNDDSEPRVTPDLFRPSWLRILFAAAVAIGGFFISQEVPLEWYPLNNPSSGLQYLEITCAANYTSTVEIFLDQTRGFNGLDAITFPIGPSEMAFTYTFPLADAPLYHIRLDPLFNGSGEFTITNFRLINRRGEEIRRFGPHHFYNIEEMQVVPLEKGWKLVMKDTHDPKLLVQIDGPIVAEGMTERNLKRCLLSTSYLAMMLWIILLAVFFTFRAPEPWQLTLKSMAFLALLGVFFSFVGNRGLIRNSIRYAQVQSPPQLEIDVVASKPGTAQLYWDAGEGLSEPNSKRSPYAADAQPQTLRFPLPAAPLHALRLDPFDTGNHIEVRAIRVSNGPRSYLASLDLNALTPADDRVSLEHTSNTLTIESAPETQDPNLWFNDTSINAINAALSQRAR